MHLDDGEDNDDIFEQSVDTNDSDEELFDDNDEVDDDEAEDDGEEGEEPNDEHQDHSERNQHRRAMQGPPGGNERMNRNLVLRDFFRLFAGPRVNMQETAADNTELVNILKELNVVKR